MVGIALDGFLADEVGQTHPMEADAGQGEAHRRLHRLAAGDVDLAREGQFHVGIAIEVGDIEVGVLLLEVQRTHEEVEAEGVDMTGLEDYLEHLLSGAVVIGRAARWLLR